MRKYPLNIFDSKKDTKTEISIYKRIIASFKN
jgi:hypothetical protein